MELRKLPLFVRIGLMWWTVLLAWPPSRAVLLIPRPAPGLDAAGHVMAALLSLAHALVAAWIVVTLLRLRTHRALLLDLPALALLIAWFALSSWAIHLPLSEESGMSWLYFAAVFVPVAAVSDFHSVALVVVLLAVVTVVWVQRSARPPDASSVAPPTETSVV
jgi:hypothetical protein